MKLIKNGYTPPSKDATIEDVISAISSFGKKYIGEKFLDDYISEIDDGILLKPNCANSSISQSIALLILAFSNSDDSSFVEFRNHGIIFNIRDCERAVEVINDLHNYKIQY